MRARPAGTDRLAGSISATMIRLLCVVLMVVGCGEKKQDAPVPAPSTKVEVEAKPKAPPADPPLDPIRVEAKKANRDALATMTQSIQCPQQAPSTYVRYCLAADDFAAGTASDLAEGDTIIVGEMSIIKPGPATVGTLGTPMPVAFLLRRAGTSVSAKQVVFQNKDNDAMATLAARIGKTIDGKWDHVDVPAVFADQLNGLSTAAVDPLDQADGALWPEGTDGMELRRAKGRWILVASPKGPKNRHVLGIFVDKHNLLGPKEKSPQTITVLHL